jgi:hemerythrin-like domain-containing protein
MTGLHQDHVNLARILRLGERELAALERGDSTDLDLLEDIMRYVTGYPDAHHHPTEDVVFERLKRRVPETAAEIDAIVAEHEEIIAKGRSFLDALEAAQDDAMMRRDELVRRGNGYFAALRRHMDTEEGRLFPSAARNLTPADWRAIEGRVEAAPDPLFGPQFDERFRHLRERIEAHGA